MCMADVVAYKAPIHCISKHSVISDIIGKAEYLSDIHKGQKVMAQ